MIDLLAVSTSSVICALITNSWISGATEVSRPWEFDLQIPRLYPPHTPNLLDKKVGRASTRGDSAELGVCFIMSLVGVAY